MDIIVNAHFKDFSIGRNLYNFDVSFGFFERNIDRTSFFFIAIERAGKNDSETY